MEPSEEPLRGIAHDLNNLLGAILNYSTLLSRQITDPLALADVAQIRNAAERAATLSLTLLTFDHDEPKTISSDPPERKVLDA
jgi:signal transduction histidine kinase